MNPAHKWMLTSSTILIISRETGKGESDVPGS
jgi:hypothetical protein